MSYFDGIKVGDKVWSCAHGECKVYSHDYVIGLEDNYGRCFSCDFNGKISTGVDDAELVPQSVFWQKPEIIDKGKPFPEFKKGDLIEITNIETNKKQYKTFIEMDEMYVFVDDGHYVTPVALKKSEYKFKLIAKAEDLR